MELLERGRSCRRWRARWTPPAGTAAWCWSAARRGSARPRWCAPSASGTAPTPRVLWGACDALRTPRPLGPLLDIAREAGGELAGLVAAEPARHRLFSAFLDLLGPAGRTPPVIAVVEDAHWADEATLDLLVFVGRRVAGVPAMVVVTYRDDEVGPAHPLETVIGDLATARWVRRIELPALSRDAVATLAALKESTPTACTGSPAATRSSSPRCSAPRAGRSRRPSATPCSPAPPGCRRPLPGATYGSFGAACHYRDGTFVLARVQELCAKRSPQTGALQLLAPRAGHPARVALVPQPRRPLQRHQPPGPPFNQG